MSKVKGHDIVVKIGGTAIGQARECTITMDRSFVEVASATSSAWKEYLPKMLSWSITCSGLISSTDASLWNAYNNGTQITVSFVVGNGYTLSGSAYIKSLKYTGPLKEYGTFSVDIQGTGQLTKA